MSAELKAGLLAAADFSGNFATAKPNINDTEQQHILGLVALLRAASDALPGDGWVLVPVDPTRAMLEATMRPKTANENRSLSVGSYKAMIDAAPQPETSP